MRMMARWRQAFSCLFVLSLCVGCTPEGSKEFDVASANNTVNLNIDELQCLSLQTGDARILGSDFLHNEKVEKLIGRQFPTARITRDDPSCRFVFGFNIIRSESSAVYLGWTKSQNPGVPGHLRVG